MEDDKNEKLLIAERRSAYHDEVFKTPYKWLELRQTVDNAEGLWRIHDKIYDFSEFVQKHPGGAEWIKWSKGMDITEHFEVHHLTSVPSQLIQKYFVKNADSPRNYRITFEHDGFYQTLKRKVVDRLKHVKKGHDTRTKIAADLLVLITFITCILTIKFQSCTLLILSSLLLTLSTISAHNFIHKKDNFRMYYFNFSMMSYKDVRIFHAMSHHMYPNTFFDVEAYIFEPFLRWDMRKKSFLKKAFSLISFVFVYILSYSSVALGRFHSIYNDPALFTYDELLPFLLPLTMYYFSNSSLIFVLIVWVIIVHLSSFMFVYIGNTAGHHNPGNICENGKSRLSSIDFGLLMIGTVTERTECKGSSLLALIIYGDHLYHHFFPTLDCSILGSIDDLVMETCKEFRIELKHQSWHKVMMGQFIQLLRNL